MVIDKNKKCIIYFDCYYDKPPHLRNLLITLVTITKYTIWRYRQFIERSIIFEHNPQIPVPARILNELNSNLKYQQQLDTARSVNTFFWMRDIPETWEPP